MRKSRIIAIAIVAALSITAVAAASQVNVYKVTGGVLPAKAGTKKKPVPAQVNFDFTVDEASGNRPAGIKTYKIKIKGMKVNQKVVKKTCTADQINATGDPASTSGPDKNDAAACPASSLVGTGFADNTVGNDKVESDQSLHCYLNLRIYNAKPGHATLFLAGHKNPNGSPSKPGDKYCIIDFAKGIDMQYSTEGEYTVLSFTIPNTVLHNIPGFTTAVRNVQSTIKKITGKINGQTHGYYESVGGCTAGKREFQVEFVPEQGTAQTSKYRSKCTA